MAKLQSWLAQLFTDCLDFDCKASKCFILPQKGGAGKFLHHAQMTGPRACCGTGHSRQHWSGVINTVPSHKAMEDMHAVVGCHEMGTIEFLQVAAQLCLKLSRKRGVFVPSLSAHRP